MALIFGEGALTLATDGNGSVAGMLAFGANFGMDVSGKAPDVVFVTIRVSVAKALN